MWHVLATIYPNFAFAGSCTLSEYFPSSLRCNSCDNLFEKLWNWHMVNDIYVTLNKKRSTFSVCSLKHWSGTKRAKNLVCGSWALWAGVKNWLEQSGSGRSWSGKLSGSHRNRFSWSTSGNSAAPVTLISSDSRARYRTGSTPKWRKQYRL